MSTKRRKVTIDVPPTPGGSTLPFAVYFPTGRPTDASEIGVSVYVSTSGRGAQHVVVGSRVGDD